MAEVPVYLDVDDGAEVLVYPDVEMTLQDTTVVLQGIAM